MRMHLTKGIIRTRKHQGGRVLSGSTYPKSMWTTFPSVVGCSEGVFFQGGNVEEYGGQVK